MTGSAMGRRPGAWKRWALGHDSQGESAGTPQKARPLAVQRGGAHGRRRRAGAALALALALAAGGVGAVGLGHGVMAPLPAAAESEGGDSVLTGEGIMFTDSQGDAHWLGAVKNPQGGNLLWCIEFGPDVITGAGEMASSRELARSDHREDTDPSIFVNPAQMYYLMLKHEATNTADSRAAISILAHGNFDISPSARALLDEAKVKYPGAWATAVAYANEARRHTPAVFEVGSAQAEDAVRTGSVTNIEVLNDDGERVAGIPVTVSLEGPAVFDATGSASWSGVSEGEAITLTWHSTGNGEVQLRTDYTIDEATITRYGNGTSVQDMLSLHPGGKITVAPPPPPEPFRVWYDFAPMARSSVAEADSKIRDAGVGVLRDAIEVMADPTYLANPNWMYQDGEPVPIVFEGTAYDTGDLPAQPQESVPAGARVIGTTTVTAAGPGRYEAEIHSDLKPHFVTWVWRVAKAKQGEYASYVARDWADGYGLEAETTSVRTPVEVVSSLSSRVTRAGTYLVDDLWVSGFDEDHTRFEGSHEVEADRDEMTHVLWFFPTGEEVSDANLAAATRVGEIKVPAVNGFHPTLGANQFRMLEGNPEGTYVFQTLFAGDGRTMPYASSVSDVHEQYTVEAAVPEIHTTARDAEDGDKQLSATGTVRVEDEVCQVEGKELEAGVEYELSATLMDRATGEALVDAEGKPYEASRTWTPRDGKDCALVTMELPAEVTVGKTLVVFERVKREGQIIAFHTDLEDAGQTVHGAEPPTAPPTPEHPATVPPTPGPDPLPRTGVHVAGLAISALGFVGAGAALLRRRCAAQGV